MNMQLTFNQIDAGIIRVERTSGAWIAVIKRDHLVKRQWNVIQFGVTVWSGSKAQAKRYAVAAWCGCEECRGCKEGN